MCRSSQQPCRVGWRGSRGVDEKMRLASPRSQPIDGVMAATIRGSGYRVAPNPT
ncbi:hypothetical protein [Oryza sativa Japonica Group]|uniref:Uncharacterized protein n=1 Tax=Oryza sativa subsp. japonica TaxID=39947 RepID=Q5JJY0_ORYSJ|nr:hypothetical protein [Oryza sativa Japonica Group]BAD88220.1 hypothetical protein [Oryza sativa Japonica Group]